MALTLTETSAAVADQTFAKRTAAAFVRHAAFLLQRTNAQLTAALPAWTPEGVRQAAAVVVRNSDSAQHRERWAYLIAGVPALTPSSDDAALEAAAQVAFPSLINPVDRTP